MLGRRIMFGMSALANYSIETDSMVLLQFRDGSHLRVELAKIGTILTPAEAEQVNKSVALRTRFIEASLPVWARMVLMTIGLAGLTFGSVKAAQRIWQQIHPVPQVQQSAEPERSARAVVAPAKAQSEPTPQPAAAVSLPAAPSASALPSLGSSSQQSAVSPVVEPAKNLINQLEPVIEPVQQLLPVQLLK